MVDVAVAGAAATTALPAGTGGLVMSPPSPPKLALAPPPPAPTVPASRSDFSTFPEDDVEDEPVPAVEPHSELSLLPLP